jgi:hypothetical protein
MGTSEDGGRMSWTTADEVLKMFATEKELERECEPMPCPMGGSCIRGCMMRHECNVAHLGS